MGYAVGGGNGWLARRYGLCSDMIDAAEVVTVDGNRRWDGADAEPDLLWALKGGAVTSALSRRCAFGLLHNRWCTQERSIGQSVRHVNC